MPDDLAPLEPVSLLNALALAHPATVTDAKATDTRDPLAELSASWLRVRGLGGETKEGGKHMAEALAQHWAPIAVADLAQRAMATKGRDADRLWRPILDVAGAIDHGVKVTVPVQVNVFPEGSVTKRLDTLEGAK